MMIGDFTNEDDVKVALLLLDNIEDVVVVVVVVAPVVEANIVAKKIEPPPPRCVSLVVDVLLRCFCERGKKEWSQNVLKAMRETTNVLLGVRWCRERWVFKKGEFFFWIFFWIFF